MPLFNEVGFAKNELNNIKGAIDFAVANDTSLNENEIGRLTQIAEIIKDMRQHIVDVDAVNTTDTNPAAVLRVAVNAF